MILFGVQLAGKRSMFSMGFIVASVLTSPLSWYSYGLLSEIDRVGKEALIKLRKFYVICSLLNRSSILRIIPCDVYITLILDRWLIVFPSSWCPSVNHSRKWIKWTCPDIIESDTTFFCNMWWEKYRKHLVQILGSNYLFVQAHRWETRKEGSISHSET